MQALHNAGRLAWGSGPRGEKPDYTGLDVIIVRGDKIAVLYVFLDSMPSSHNNRVLSPGLIMSDSVSVSYRSINECSSDRSRVISTNPA